MAKFLDRKIRFLEIPEMISEAMTEVDYIAHPGLEEISPRSRPHTNI